MTPFIGLEGPGSSFGGPAHRVTGVTGVDSGLRRLVPQDPLIPESGANCSGPTLRVGVFPWLAEMRCQSSQSPPAPAVQAVQGPWPLWSPCS